MHTAGNLSVCLCEFQRISVCAQVWVCMYMLVGTQPFLHTQVHLPVPGSMVLTVRDLSGAWAAGAPHTP